MAPESKHAKERRYALFVHYGLREGRDWQHQGDFNISIFTERLLDRLLPDLSYLNTLLAHHPADCPAVWKGFAFVFLDMGWTDLLKGELQPINAATLAVEVAQAHKEIEHRLNATLKSDRRVRIVSVANLVKLLSLLETLASQTPRQKNAFHEWLTGGGASLRYDGAKVIEGAVRIANIGRQVPVFRFDDDVIFYGRRAYAADDSRRSAQIDRTARSIYKLCGRYVELSDDPVVNYFVFSGSYGGATARGEGETDRATALLNGYATRVGQLASLPASGSVSPDAEAPLSLAAAEAFLASLPKLGAHPERQAISGAGLCLSDGAILDLPPFSNMHLNVMWIDDHLKYALHHELGHLGLRTQTPHSARVRGAVFSQLRHRPGDFRYRDVRWHTKTYLQRLLLGCVADAWLRADVRLKEAISPLPEMAREGLLAKVPGAYAAEFIKVMPADWDAYPDLKQGFKNKLWRLAVQRLNDVTREWQQPAYHDTFLGLFATGRQHERYETFREYLPVTMHDGLRLAVAQLDAQGPCPPVDIDHDRLDDLPLAQALALLIDDFAGYFDLVLFWKNFVQSVRFLLNQERTSRKALQWLVPFESDIGFSNDVIAPTVPKSRLLKVFLCHGSEDKPAVRALHGQLKQDGVQPWLDECDLTPGRQWAREIEAAVRDSDVILVCLSGKSMGRPGYLQKEIKFVLDVADEQPEGSIYVIPVKLDDFDLPQRLAHLQAVNVTTEHGRLSGEAGYDKLMSALKLRANQLDITLVYPAIE